MPLILGEKLLKKGKWLKSKGEIMHIMSCLKDYDFSAITGRFVG